VAVGCAVLAAVTAQSAALRLRGRLSLVALVGAPLLVLLASWTLWMASFIMACNDVGSPFFRLSCN